jgi:hypothetical protein
MRLRVIIAAFCFQLVAINATAGIISLSQHDIIDEFDIANTGTLVVANSVGDLPITGTINSVVFGTDQSGLGNFNNGGGDFSTQYAAASGLDNVLSSLVFTADTNPGTLTLGGLTIGNTYRLQLLFSNTQNGTGDDQRVSVLGSNLDVVDMGNRGINVVAEFTADNVTLLSSILNQGPRTVLNGYALHELSPVPAPGVMAIFGLGALGIAIQRRRRKDV